LVVDLVMGWDDDTPKPKLSQYAAMLCFNTKKGARLICEIRQDPQRGRRERREEPRAYSHMQ